MADTRILTYTDKKKLENELEELKTVKTKEVAEEIQTARGFGDLSENAEYDAAKKEEARIYGRIKDIEQILSTSTFVDDSDVNTETVSMGNIVKVLSDYGDGDTEEEEITLVGFTEADPLKNFISNESPVGKALVGATIGQTVEADTPGGKVKMTVRAIKKRYAQPPAAASAREVLRRRVLRRPTRARRKEVRYP